MDRRITQLTAQKRNPRRINVYLDGEYALSLTRLVAAWLAVGQELSEEKIQALQAEDRDEEAFQRALKLLNHRMRSAAEIQKNLRSHQLPEETIKNVVDRLQRSGLVDDRRFAELWIENRNEFRPRSRRALYVELRQRGVPAEIIEVVLENLDEGELAYQAAAKQFRKVERKDKLEFRRKLNEFLARRGFSYDVIAPVVARLWSEGQSDASTGANTSTEGDGS